MTNGKVKMYQFIFKNDDFTIRIPLSGGKAGRGRAKTSNVQVCNKKTLMVEKRFLFKVNDFNSRDNAISKALDYITALNQQP